MLGKLYHDPCARCISLVIAMITIPCIANAQSSADALNWHEGPTTARFHTHAHMKLPDGYVWIDGPDTRTLMTSMGNPASGTEVGLVAPEEDDWFIVFEYDNIGYIQDEDADDLDADALLESIREGTEAANRERRKQGWGELNIVGWEQEPHYDKTTNNLVWAIRGRSEEGDVINYNTRRLGRKGVMSIALVLGPEQLDSVIPKFNRLMSAYEFNSGQKYSEFREGDKIAQYGLTALITGGAAAVAVKSGLLKYLWKGIVVAVIAVGAFFKKIFGGGSND